MKLGSVISPLAVALMATVLGLGINSKAQAVSFDPDGNPGTLNTINLGSVDWVVSNFLALNGAQAFVSGSGTQFDVLTQARVGTTSDPNGVLNTPTGLNTTFEYTMVARFTETIVTTGAGFAQFTVDTTKPIFLEIYYDTTPDAVDISGSGFNDGRLILKGTLIQSATGFFLVTDPTAVPLDQSPNGNQYTGQNTLTGTGSESNIAVGGLTTDPTFFLQALQSFGISFENISIGLPYQTVDPADCYTLTASGLIVGQSTAPNRPCDTAHTNGLMSAQTSAFGGYVPQIGVVNGFGPGIGGPDFVAQTDYNSSFRAAVPEPSSMLLLGSGLVGLAAALRMRTKAKRN